MDVLIQLAVTGIIMGAIDALWLSVVAKKFYYSQIGSLLRQKPDMVAAVVFYILYVIGIVVFVLQPALEQDSWQYALQRGGMFGLVAYATYDLTNRATLKLWSWRLVAVDIAWGVVLTAVVSAAAYGAIVSWIL